MFVVRDNKAVFTPVKTGIAGEKYFEVLSGANVGDQVIIGPFSSVRELRDGAAVKIEARRRGRDEQADRRTHSMFQFLEAAGIALDAIWSNKLRSFMTVLGNIVAVTSIIAVVSLVQGMNEYVTNAIVTDVGADNFTIQRMPVIRTQADEDRVRNNPRLTLREASAIRRFSDNIGALCRGGQRRRADVLPQRERSTARR